MANQGNWHEQFAAGDLSGGAVTIQSCDNVKFSIHRKNLEAGTGAFPGAEFETHGEVVHLTERADVLAILFKFIYPQRHPGLEDLEFALLSQVAEAAEKYEVFAAMNIASIRLSETLPDHALDLLAHGIKHNYPKLIDKAAICVARYTWASMTQRLPVVAMHAWAKYQESLGAVFIAGIAALTRLQQDRQSCSNRSTAQTGYLIAPQQPSPDFICNNCFFMLKAWVMGLEKVVGGTADLLWAIAHPGDMDRPLERRTLPSQYILPGPTGRGRNSRSVAVDVPMERTCAACPDHNAACIHLAVVQGVLQDAIKKVPPFSSFL